MTTRRRSVSVRHAAPVISLLFCVALLAVPRALSRVQESSAHFVRAEGTRIVAPDGTPLRLRGIGLGNWLLVEGYMFRLDEGPQSERQIRALVAELVGPDEGARFWRTYQDVYVAEADIDFIKRVGFNSIRVPFNYRLLTPEDRPGAWLEEGFERLDRIMSLARRSGLYVVLDMHAAPGGQTGENIDDSWGRPWLFASAESQELTIEIWKRIASRYRDEPTLLGYELLNEPLPHWEELRKYDAMLEPFYKRVTAAIREVDPNHLVILGGAKWNRDFSVFGAPFAPALVYAFHKYWDETTEASIEPYLAFRKERGVPIWLGESGENTDQWVSATVRLAEQHDIGWCFWPYKKMEVPSAVVSFERPAHWDEVVAYARLRDADFDTKRKARPSTEVGRAALADLLQRVKFERCRVNESYIRALGLTP
jgi:hypothetical protein